MRRTTIWNNVFTGAYPMPGNGPTGEVNLTYSVTHNNAFIVGVDEYVSLHRVNQAWLDGEFAGNEQPHVFVFGHEPAFEVRHTDCLGSYPDNRDTFWSSIADENGRTYFCGHDHFYDHAGADDADGDPDDDVHQYVVGTAGAPLRTWDGLYGGDNGDYGVVGIAHEQEYGYILGEVDGLDVTLTWMWRDGADSFVAGDQWSYTAVPEPATACMLLLGAAALLRRRGSLGTDATARTQPQPNDQLPNDQTELERNLYRN